ncbi:MAG: hypothetical protein V1917_02710 [Candidatus Gottesmanbacteria bacterium]
MDLKAKFQSVYANLPLGARTEIVATIEGEPMTWNAVFIEVQEDTEKSKKILVFLEQIGVLK